MTPKKKMKAKRKVAIDKLKADCKPDTHYLVKFLTEDCKDIWLCIRCGRARSAVTFTFDEIGALIAFAEYCQVKKMLGQKPTVTACGRRTLKVAPIRRRRRRFTP